MNFFFHEVCLIANFAKRKSLAFYLVFLLKVILIALLNRLNHKKHFFTSKLSPRYNNKKKICFAKFNLYMLITI